jgi:hypothetical protein
MRAGLQPCSGLLDYFLQKGATRSHQAIPATGRFAVTNYIGLDMPTMHLGATVTDLRQFVVRVQNRRRRVTDCENKEEFAPVYQEKLWKLKVDGDRQNPEHWFVWLPVMGAH